MRLIISFIVIVLLFGSFFLQKEKNIIKHLSPKNISSRFSKADEGIKAIATHNHRHQNIDYYYYIPKNLNKNKPHPVLVLVPGYNETGKSLVNKQFKNFALSEEFVIIAPTFTSNEEEFDQKISYQYPSAWSGKTLVKILQELAMKDIYVSKLYLFGFSAGAQFVERFSLWYPKICSAVAAHSAGGYTLPQSYNNIKYLITVGVNDTEERQANLKTFKATAEARGINVETKIYNLKHKLTKTQISDSIEFFKQVKNN